MSMERVAFAGIGILSLSLLAFTHIILMQIIKGRREIRMRDHEGRPR